MIMMLRPSVVWLITLVVLGWCFLSSQIVFGNVNVGESLIMKGDYQGAIKTLTPSSKGNQPSPVRAQAFKWIGVAQYMLGQKDSATKSFQFAVRLNPRITLSADEVADESIVPIFNGIKTSNSSKQPTTATAAGASKTAVPSMVGANGRVPSKESSATAKARSLEASRTLILIKSNVPSAQIIVDGVLAGSIGTEIDVDPGTREIDVTAKGYITARRRVTIKAKTLNTLTIDLNRPKPKAAVVKAPANPKARQNSGGSDLFGPTTASDPGLVMPATPSPSTRAMGVVPPPLPQQPQPMYQQPMYQQPMYQQPMYQQPMYQQPMYQPPPPGYQQPMYAPPNPYYPPPQQPYSPYAPFGSPYGGYIQPQAPMYAPPSIYQPYVAPPPQQSFAPPPIDPYSSGAAMPTLEPPTADLPPPSLEESLGSEPVVSSKSSKDDGRPPPMKPPINLGSSKRSKSSAKSSDSGCGVFIRLLPLGAGQFCQGKFLRGLMFAGAQVGGAYFWKANSDAAAKYQGQLDQVLADRQTERETVPAGDQAQFDVDTGNKETEGKAAINQASQNATMSIAVAGGAYAVSIIDAFLFDTPTKKPKKRAKLSLNLPFETTTPSIKLSMMWPNLGNPGGEQELETFAALAYHQKDQEFERRSFSSFNSILVGLKLSL